MLIRIVCASALVALGLVTSLPSYASEEDAPKKQHAIMIIVHKVDDYDSWKKKYEAHATDHAKMGIRDLNLYQVIGHPNEVVVEQETDDLEKAKAFLMGPDSEKMYRGAGVVGKPEIFFVEKAK